MDNKNTQNQIEELRQEISDLKTLIKNHLHTGLDGTEVLRRNIVLDNDQYLQIGLGSQATAPIIQSNLGKTSEQIQYSIGVGKDDGRTGFVQKVKNMQVDFLHQPNNTSKQSFIVGRRDGVSGVAGSISTTSGGNTATINGYSFTTNELANAVVNIYNSSGTFVESKIIASNTATQITISGTWGASTSGGAFIIYFPLFMGSADTIWQRFYAQEGTDGGIRFGIGATNGGQNGLLYSDATGNLYWRNKAGTSTKLN